MFGSRIAGVLAAVLVMMVAVAARASVPSYVSAGSFLLSSPSAAFDVQGDGRVVLVDENGVVRRQNTVNGSAYTAIGSIPSGLLPFYGASFIKISPDGSRVAIGDNGFANKMYVVASASLNTGGPTTPTTVSVGNFSGAWADNATLYVGGSPDFVTPPGLYRVSVTGNTVSGVVSNIGDGSGGVAIRAGKVYTAIGYDASPGEPRRGEVRSFDLATLSSAGSPVDFSTGTLATQANSASTLDFDAMGNIIIAGGGGVSVIDLATAERYDLPGLSSGGFYSAQFDAATGEILVRDFNSSAATIVRFAVPGPGTGVVMLVMGAAVGRRRSRAHA